LQQLETRMGTFKTPFLTVEFFTQLCRHKPSILPSWSVAP
jgi:hypothetical protein